MRAGGGENHRRGLYDAILVKENHATRPAASARRRRGAALKGAAPAGVLVEVECATLDEVGDALDGRRAASCSTT